MESYTPVIPVSEGGFPMHYPEGFCPKIPLQIHRGKSVLHQRVILRFKILGESENYSEKIPFLEARCRRETTRISKISARRRILTMNPMPLYRIPGETSPQFRRLDSVAWLIFTLFEFE